MSGKWNELPARLDSLVVARDLVDKSSLDDALEFIRKFSAELKRNDEFIQLLVWLGDRLVEHGRTEEGLTA